MVPKNFEMVKVNNDELRFKFNSGGLNIYVLSANKWNDGQQITIVESKEDIQQSDCFRGTSIAPEIANNYVTEDINYFYCKNRTLRYNISSDKRFGIQHLILKETEKPDTFEVVNYEFYQEE